jgi:hypothetical protein
LFAGVVDTGGNFAAGVVDTDGKFAKIFEKIRNGPQGLGGN